MKKQTLAVVALVSILTVGAFAHGGDNDENQRMMNGQNQGMMGGQNQMAGQNQQKAWNNNSMQNRGTMYKQGRGMPFNGMQNASMMGRQGMGMMGGQMMGGMQMFSQLKLNNEQRFQLSIIRDEMRLNMKKLMHTENTMGQMGDFIKGNTFDTSAFKQSMNKKHDKILDLMSKNMEKVFKVLTKEQIAELKKNFAKK